MSILSNSAAAHPYPKPNLSALSDYRSALGLLRKRIWFQCCFSPQIPLNLLNSPLFRVRGVDVVKFEKKIMPQNSLSLSDRESVVGKWRCGISKMTAMRVWHGLRYKTCYNFSENIVSNNYSSCQKSLNSLIQVLSLQAKDRLKFVTRSNSITYSIIRVFVNLFLCILKNKRKESIKNFHGDLYIHY